MYCVLYSTPHDYCTYNTMRHVRIPPSPVGAHTVPTVQYIQYIRYGTIRYLRCNRAHTVGSTHTPHRRRIPPKPVQIRQGLWPCLWAGDGPCFPAASAPLLLALAIWSPPGDQNTYIEYTVQYIHTQYMRTVYCNVHRRQEYTTIKSQTASPTNMPMLAPFVMTAASHAHRPCVDGLAPSRHRAHLVSLSLSLFLLLFWCCLVVVVWLLLSLLFLLLFLLLF